MKINEIKVEKVQTKDLVNQQADILKTYLGKSQKRVAAMKVTLAQAQVNAALVEITYDKSVVKDLELQIWQLNQVLKVSLLTLFINTVY